MLDSNTKNKASVEGFVKILMILSSVIFFFAILKADVSVIKSKQDDLHNRLILHEIEAKEVYVRQDVFGEQYKNILKELKDINKKLEKQ